ncbi:MAG: hypothetical protein NVS3B24_03920 [Candidatus Dormibacteria bacterium]
MIRTKHIMRRTLGVLATGTLVALQMQGTVGAYAAPPARTLTWSGASPSNSPNWSAIGNWNAGNPSPAFTDSLVFPPGARNTTNINDIPGLTGLGSITISAPYSISGMDVGVTGGIQDTAGVSTISNNINLPTSNSPENLLVDSASLNLTGVLSGGQPRGAFTKSGSGTLQLSNAANTINGVVTISAGTLSEGATNAIPTTDPVVMSGGATPAALALNSFSQTLPSIDGDAGSSIDTGTGALVLNGNGLAAGSSPHTVAGPISGAGGLTLSPSPAYAQILSSNSTYSGPTVVTSGYLQVDGTSPRSPLTVGPGQLSGSGTVGAIHAVSGGTVYPEDGAVPGTANSNPLPTVLGAASAVLDGGSNLNVNLRGKTPGGAAGYSQLNSGGPVDLTGAPNLNIFLNYSPAGGDSLTLVQGSSVVGTFAGIPQDAVIPVGSPQYPAQVHYNSNSLVLTFLNWATTTTVNCSPPGTPTTPSSRTVGGSTTCTATVTDASSYSAVTKSSPTGTVTFSSSNAGGTFSPSKQCTLVADPTTPGKSTCGVNYTSASADYIFATYSGDRTHSPSGSLHGTSTTVGCVPSSVQVQGSTTCSVTVTDTDAAPSAPAGTVTLGTDSPGTFSSNTCTLGPSNGSQSYCQVTYTPSAYGTHNISATYLQGDGVHSASSGSTPLTVTARSTSTTVQCAPSSPGINSPTTCTATVTDTAIGSPSAPAGTVTFSSNGGSGSFTGNPCTLGGSGSSSTCSVTYTPNAGGSQTISGSYASTDGVHGGSASTGAGNGSIQATALQPIVYGVSPNSGAFPGGSAVSIFGAYFFGGTSACDVTGVNFGRAAAPLPPISCTDGVVKVTSPQSLDGATVVDVTVTTHGGTTAVNQNDRFRYVHGYNILTGAGGIYSFGDATYHGNLIDHGYPGPAIGLSETPDGGGYAIVTTPGNLYTFGNANYFGNLNDPCNGARPCNTPSYPGPAVAFDYTPGGGSTTSGQGYSILNAGGGLYSFGDAQGHYYGNLIDCHCIPAGVNLKAVSFAWSSTGNGYWILADNGAIYSFGDAVYYGNLLDHGYPGRATGLTRSSDGRGYSILTQEGGIYSFGDAVGQYYGNLIDHGYPAPGVAFSSTP